MVQKFLTRKENEIRDKDEWSYISVIGSREEIKDVMEAPERSISFSTKIEHAPQKWDDRTEKIRWALDAAGNACQYIKYFNLKVDKHNKQIAHIKKIQDRFDREINLLQSYKLNKISLDKKSLSDMDIRSIKSLMEQLILAKRTTLSKLGQMKNEFVSIENELRQQESEVEKIRKHLSARIFRGEETTSLLDELEAIQTIRKELSSLSKNYDIDSLTYAVEMMISSRKAA